jgi:branched-chain amino acid transport system permease protein
VSDQVTATHDDDVPVDDRPAEVVAAEVTGRRWTTGRIVRLAVTLAVLLVLLAIPLYVEATWLRVGEYAMVGAVAAIGLTMLTGHCGQLSLGTPFFMLVGATTYATLASEDVEGRAELVALNWPPLLALVAAVVVAASAGLAFAPVAGRVGGIYLSVATLALVFIGLYLGQRFSELTGGAATGRPTPPLTVGGFSFTTGDPDFSLLGVPLYAQERMWYLFLLFTAGSYFLAVGAVRSRPGRMWRAVRDNPASALAMGVNVSWARASAFAVSSGFAGLAGVMTILWFNILKADETEFSGSWSITVAIGLLAMIIIGGLGSIGGAVVGAAFVFALPLALQLLANETGFLSGLTQGEGGFTPVVLTAFAYGALIVVLVIFEPGGLAAIGRRLTGFSSSRRSG